MRLLNRGLDRSPRRISNSNNTLLFSPFLALTLDKRRAEHQFLFFSGGSDAPN